MLRLFLIFVSGIGMKIVFVFHLKEERNSCIMWRMLIEQKEFQRYERMETT